MESGVRRGHNNIYSRCRQCGAIIEKTATRSYTVANVQEKKNVKENGKSHINIE